MDINDVLRRKAALKAEMDGKLAAHQAGQIETKSFNAWAERALDEAQELRILEKNFKEAQLSEARQESLMGGTAFSGADPIEAQSKSLPSVWDITDDQWAQMKWAFDSRVPCRIEVKSGPGKRTWHSKVQTKAAFSTTSSMSGGPYAGNIPPLVTPWAVAEAYEPVRAANYLTNVAMPGASAVWYTATNGAEAGGVNELGTKIDINPSIAGSQVLPQKIAGIYTFSFESQIFTEGFGESAVQTLLTHNLQSSLINNESLAILTASTAGTNPLGAGFPVSYKFNGLLNSSGTLTRAAATGENPFTTLAKGFADVRVGSAFADPSHVWMHPNTLTALRTLRDSSGRFIWDLMNGPANFSALGQTAAPSTDREAFTMIPIGKNGYSGTLFGASVISTTHVPAGTAIVQNVPAGGGVAWHKTGFILEMDNGLSGTNFQNNAYSVRAEELISFSLPRPSACNIITQLPTQAQ
jgi:HK97 family phage major capsid protein